MLVRAVQSVADCCKEQQGTGPDLAQCLLHAINSVMQLAQSFVILQASCAMSQQRMKQQGILVRDSNNDEHLNALPEPDATVQSTAYTDYATSS